MLVARVGSVLPTSERYLFDNTTRIYFTNSNVRDFNNQRLAVLNTPVIKLKAKYNNKAIRQRALVNKYSQLEAEIEVSISYKIILLKNIQTKAGLVNGTTRFLYNIKQALGTSNPRATLPYYLIVRIKKADYTRLQL